MRGLEFSREGCRERLQEARCEKVVAGAHVDEGIAVRMFRPVFFVPVRSGHRRRLPAANLARFRV